MLYILNRSSEEIILNRYRGGEMDLKDAEV